MTDEDRITLDRTNLKRLAAVMRTTPEAWPPGDYPPGLAQGWVMACDALDAMANEMPHLYGAEAPR